MWRTAKCVDKREGRQAPPSPSEYCSRVRFAQDEVMTRRYGWRAVLKAMKMEGTHKESEVEIKILPVNTLSKVKQAS